MSLPPEHISIKRRRQEDPVDVLYLENDRPQSKRRFTDYCFQRVKANAEAPAPPDQPSVVGAGGDLRAASNHAASGVPTVRATAPGDEIKDEAKRQAAQDALRSRYSFTNAISSPKETALTNLEIATLNSPQRESRPLAPLRKFHLYSGPGSSYAGVPSGIRKRKAARRDHMATFIERSSLSRRGSEFLSDLAETQSRVDAWNGRVKSSTSRQDSFNNPKGQIQKAGQSMHDHPSTSDDASDQLAKELAAFAAELSRGEKQRKTSESTEAARTHVSGKDIKMDGDGDYVYDTYIRVPACAQKSSQNPTSGVGLLVIEDEDEALWQTFIESESDSEWDEDDPDSNAEDNPANEYPDEEVDSDDEYGSDMYGYDKDASDDGEYDLNEPWNYEE